MAVVPTGITIGWPGTHAAIPTGWSRVTDLDDRFIKGTAAGVNPNVTGGAATHTHTSPTHAHAVAAHTHGAGTSGTMTGGQTASGTAHTTRDTATHTHTIPTTGSASGTTSSVVATYQSSSSEPAHIETIYISSGGSQSGLPDNSVAFYDAAAAPTGWIQHAASRNLFLRGASTGGNAGGTGGGAHVHAANAHVHTKNHTHTSAASGAGSAQVITATSGGVTRMDPSAHAVTISASGDVPSQTSASTASTTSEPSFHTLLGIENNTGGNSFPALVIAMWLGVLSGIPASWVLCDGSNGTPDMRGKFLKIANAGGDVGDTGGSSSHDHTDPAGHTHANHTHSATLAAQTTEDLGLSGSGTPVAHTHTATTAAAGATAAVVQTVDSTADTQPAFRTVAYIEYQPLVIVPAPEVMTLAPVTPSITLSVGVSGTLEANQAASGTLEANATASGTLEN